MLNPQPVHTNYPFAGEPKAEPPKTLASAVSRLDGINEHLAKVAESLSQITSHLGVPVLVSGGANGKQATPGGMVHRLNDTAEDAHVRLTEIEALIAGIGRALG